MKKYVLTALTVLALAAPWAVRADSTNASAKVALQSSYLNVLGPHTASTATRTNITGEWQTVLQQTLKTANNYDLLINAAFEVGLYTETVVGSKLMVTDTATATADIKVRALVDGAEATPGPVVYGKRTQTLTAQLEGAIANCLSIVTNASGGLQLVLNTNCVQPEVIGLLQDTMTANSFMFAFPNVSSGVHDIQIQARIDAMGNNQNGSFVAMGVLGKGTLTAESVRLVKDPVYPFTIGPATD